MLALKREQERAEPVTHGEGNRSGEEPEKQPRRTLRCRDASQWDVVKADDGTGEVSSGQ